MFDGLSLSVLHRKTARKERSRKGSLELFIQIVKVLPLSILTCSCLARRY